MANGRLWPEYMLQEQNRVSHVIAALFIIIYEIYSVIYSLKYYKRTTSAGSICIAQWCTSDADHIGI